MPINNGGPSAKPPLIHNLPNIHTSWTVVFSVENGWQSESQLPIGFGAKSLYLLIPGHFLLTSADGRGQVGRTPEAPGEGTFLGDYQGPGMTVMGADHAAEAVKSQHRGLILAIIWRGRRRGSFIQYFLKRTKRLILFLLFREISTDTDFYGNEKNDCNFYVTRRVTLTILMACHLSDDIMMTHLSILFCFCLSTHGSHHPRQSPPHLLGSLVLWCHQWFVTPAWPECDAWHRCQWSGQGGWCVMSGVWWSCHRYLSNLSYS